MTSDPHRIRRWRPTPISPTVCCAYISAAVAPADAGAVSSMDRLLPQLIGYGLASGVALGFDMGTLIGLTHAGMPYLPASALGFTIGAVVAYLLSIRFVFSTHVIHNRALEFSTFLALGIAGLLVNTLVMRIAVGSFGTNLIAAKGMAACCTFGTNFALRRQVLFRTRRVAR